ncbi:J domain-containing protein DDB_G0295729 isoform X2 [Drosophila sulfurigaster albostrigata]|uniref:J domain-containing protein DDB_G0295729 isoform X2 n=1 Tax=Drosophila sulfurigaster albostrigata TaxID=89887 RepID=UPI002D219CA4|nr:J domain-containing protein DDB_G0295729 isoform X2 [Drosophila sulfurigaster albostrigata]
MNNFTTTTAAVPKKESLPRSGHVNEVCKEWLVREDGALAYKLQSQEINDFYKGNRYRNAVVREDFPTALHEQIKETEQAQRQVEAYRRRLTEQEEHDKRVAKEIADKLERDLQEQQQKELQQSELIAQKMQEIYVNLPPVPPPATRDKSRPPPRPAKASIHQQQQQQLQQQQQQQHQLLTNGSLEPSTSQQARYLSQQQQQQQQPLQLQQQHFSQTDNYVGLSLIPNILEMPTAAAAAAAATPSRQAQQQAHAQLQTQQQQHNNQLLVSDAAVEHAPHQQQQQQQLQQQSRFHHAHAPQSHQSARRINSNSSNNNTTTSQHNNNTPNAINQSQSHSLSHSPDIDSIDELVDYADVADSIRNMSATSAAAADAAIIERSASNENLLRTEHKFQKLSPEKYDQMVGNFALPNAKAVERHMQQHADDIELYVDLCEYGSLRDIGVPAEEALEMSKKLKQEQKDEILARRLQAIESKDNMRQEQRDRMLAIEAQDKELAKMLQEREKAKVKRAKEKARLRKSQQKEAANGGNSSSSSLLCGTNGLASHCGPLLSLPQDCMSASSSTSQAQLDIDVEAYSNPIDVLNSSRQAQEQQRQPNGLLTNGSLTRDSSSSQGSMQRQQRQAAAAAHSLNRGDDDIYTLPVDSCRLGIQGQRPISLHMAAETVQQQQQQQQQHNSMTRSEHFGSEAGSHDSTLSSGHDVSPHMKYSKSGGNFDQSASPTPPYMPIQGTRRSNSSEDRKKKSKDNKCTHQ